MATEQSDQALAVAALRGISVVCSCGDNGAAGLPLSTRVHADYPASSPWVLGCGGTTVRPDNAGTDREIVWNDGLGASGGGVSAITPRPAWQSAASVPEPVDAWERPDFLGRGVPDVAAVADLTTGVAVVDAAGNTVMGGGTSVSAPIWAGLLARCREQSGERLGFVTPLLYQQPAGVRDVPKGDNGAYPAARGEWDPCTGLGVPDGKAFLEVVRRYVSGGLGRQRGHQVEREGGRRGFAAVGRAELHHDVADVDADGLLTDEEGAGDLPVGAPGGDEGQHLLLAAGQPEPLGGAGRRRLGLRRPLDREGRAAGKGLQLAVSGAACRSSATAVASATTVPALRFARSATRASASRHCA